MSESSTSQRWHSLLSQQLDGIDELVDKFMARVGENESYHASGLDDDVLREASVKALSLLLEALIDPEKGTAVAEFATRLGSRRAREGRSLDSLLAAIRLDFSVLWSGLLSSAGRKDAHTIATHAEDVWAVVDRFARSVQTAYLTEQDRLGRERQDVQRRHVSLLFDTAGQIEVNSMSIARALNVSENSFFRVVAVPSEAGVVLRQNIDRTTGSPGRIFTHELGRHLIAFWPVERDEQRTMSSRERRILAKVPVAVAPVARSLSDIPLAALAATRMADQLDPELPLVTDLRTSWPALAKRHLTEIGCDLGQYLLIPLRDGKPGEDERLIETMLVYLRSGSLTKTSESLYCHRNTIINRLRRIEELTGLDLTDPSDSALALVALADYQP